MHDQPILDGYKNIELSKTDGGLFLKNDDAQEFFVGILKNRILEKIGKPMKVRIVRVSGWSLANISATTITLR